MKFNQLDLQYLNGNKFSNGHTIKIGEKQGLTDRISLIAKMIKGRSTLHFGCVDHLPLIEDKVKNGTWLHEILTRESSECLGIDNNEEGIKYLEDKLGCDNVMAIDIIKDQAPKKLLEKKWEYVVMGEIIEHLDNPVLFLQSIREKINCERIIITVPNAFSFNNVKNIFKNVELINSDHRFWFTPYTISKVLSEAGFEVEEFHFCNGYPFKKSRKRFFKRYLLKSYPALNSNLLAVAKV